MSTRSMVALILLLTLSACTRGPSGAIQAGKTPTANAPYDAVARSRDLAQLSDGEIRWQRAAIANYRISVTEMTNSRWQTMTITVRNGAVVDQMAICQRSLAGPNPCRVDPFKAEDFTVPSLFARARDNVNNASLVVTLELDATYGYPAKLGSSRPDAVDSSYAQRVESFQALP